MSSNTIRYKKLFNLGGYQHEEIELTESDYDSGKTIDDFDKRTNEVFKRLKKKVEELHSISERDTKQLQTRFYKEQEINELQQRLKVLQEVDKNE